MKNLLSGLFAGLFLILAAPRSIAQCNGDATAPVASCIGQLHHDLPTTGTRSIPAAEFDAGSYDNCSPSNALQFFIETGTPSAAHPTTTELVFSAAQAGQYTVVFWVVDEQGNESYCTSDLDLTVCQATSSLVCNDLVFVSLGENYTATFVADQMLEGGPYCDYREYLVGVGINGTFLPELSFGPADVGTKLVAVKDVTTGNKCWGNVQILPGVLISDCPLMFVHMASNSIRPCRDNHYYLTYINASSSPISGTYIDVALDSSVTYQGTNFPTAPTSQGNNTYRFETGTLLPGEPHYFWVKFFVDCDDPVGRTYCSEAFLHPDTICPGSGPWSGAEVSVGGYCANDSIFLTIKNIGTGPNAQTLGYVVVEDVLMRESGTFNLGPGMQQALDPFKADGSTIRLEAEQEPGFPYAGLPSIAIEGCGGFTQGMVTQFPNTYSNPFQTLDCRESTNSFDPNDKQALPKGAGDEHLLDKNIPLDYMIRFQNTGTDTAFKVVILDTLSAFLDAAKVRPGASSHPYTWERVQGNILRFTFDNILLPDSNVNEAASHGFIQFSIPQVADNPDGTRIENTAAIYFDFNAPVLTNTTFHTIGRPYVLVSTDQPQAGLPVLQVYPNPASDFVRFMAEVPGAERLSFRLTDALGRPVRQAEGLSLPWSLECRTLPPGVYFFRFDRAGSASGWSGRLLIR